jgi:5-methylcytosine-specific restriction endonuclease McrA
MNMIIHCIQCQKEHKACRSTQRFCSQTCTKTYQYAHGLKPNTTKANETLRKYGNPKRRGQVASWIIDGRLQSIGIKISESKIGKQIPKLQGSNHWNWKGGKSKDIWKTPEYQQWRKAVMRRDNFTCVECGDSRGGNLEADHIKPKYWYPELIFDLDNGRTLCKDCHKKTPTWGFKVFNLVPED